MARRFYKTVEAVACEGGYGVLLDGRAVRTPAKRPLTVSTEALARDIAGEWAAQSAEIQPASMPLTQISCTALDLLAEPEAVGRAVDELVSFAETELLCYRAEDPPELAERQEALWQPLLDWLALTHDAPLMTTTGILAVEQPRTALDALRGLLGRFEPPRLAALATAVRASGSLVVGLALLDGRIDVRQAFEASELDETFNIERWGEDPLAKERRDGVLFDLDAAWRFSRLLSG